LNLESQPTLIYWDVFLNRNTVDTLVFPANSDPVEVKQRVLDTGKYDDRISVLPRARPKQLALIMREINAGLK
jgi:hypothetical protein